MGICTNKPYEITLLALEGLEIDVFFKGVTGGDSSPFNKPDPRHILTTLELMKSETHRAVMVGDSLVDTKAGHGAGLPVIAVNYGYSSEPAESFGANSVIEDFALLPQAIAMLNSLQ